MLAPDKQEKEDNNVRDVLPFEKKNISVDQSSKRARVSRLTPREHDLYLLLIEGYTLKKSATMLGVKYSTANTHMTCIYRKLEVNSRAELIINYRDVD